MIGLIFSLSFLLVFMLQLMAQDTIIFVRKISLDVKAYFGHDTYIYPDYENQP